MEKLTIYPEVPFKNGNHRNLKTCIKNVCSYETIFFY